MENIYIKEDLGTELLEENDNNKDRIDYFFRLFLAGKS